MDRETIARRNNHALIELERRGVLKTGNLPVGQRVIMEMFPRLKVPHYGSHIAWTLIMATLFAIGMALPLALIAHGSNGLGPWGVGIVAAIAGLLFGGLMVAFMRSVHRRLRLTPWDALDTLPGGLAPEGVPTYDELENEAMRKANRFSARVR